MYDADLLRVCIRLSLPSFGGSGLKELERILWLLLFGGILGFRGVYTRIKLERSRMFRVKGLGFRVQYSGFRCRS